MRELSSTVGESILSRVNRGAPAHGSPAELPSGPVMVGDRSYGRPRRRAPDGAHGGTGEGEAAPLGGTQKSNDQRTDRGSSLHPQEKGLEEGFGCP
jgi:hypothetical protein